MPTMMEYLAVAPSVAAVAAFGLAYLDKLPGVRKRPVLATILDQASAAAGNLALDIPPGTTKEQAEALAVKEAAAILAKTGGSATNQADIVNLILGELGHILPPGHIVPAALQPAASELQKLIALLQAQLAANAAVSIDPAPAPVVVVQPVAPVPVSGP
jgi:hypothetical protein